MKNIERKIIAILGPTASGKTAVGVKLAKKFNGEIVSADSRQIFRGLDLGTGKEGKPAEGGQLSVVSLPKGDPPLGDCQLSVEQLKKCLRYIDNIPQWMIDVANPEEDYNMFKWLEGAKIAIEDIFSRGKLPIIVGGTGLYAQALLEGFELKSKFQNPNYKQRVIPAPIVNRGKRPAGIQSVCIDSGSQATVRNDRYEREQLEKLMIGQLQQILREIDLDIYNCLADQKNPHRLIRAIERAQSGEEMTKVKPDWDVLQIGLEWPREILNLRIDKRAEERFEQGMLGEIIGLLQSGVNVEWLIGLGLEYGIIGNFAISNFKPCLPAGRFQISNKTPMTKSQFRKIANTMEFEMMNQTLKLRSHQYAKRQMTWFKRFLEIVWLKEYDDIEKRAEKFLLNG